ncbi:fasciclin domain-containing protein [Haloferula rosea]|uniref:Fasciclin domain-containing protein n=1 Tax=Haloferula rosea TaxID=490093 RepID=A0A934RFA9_9BACT|nr:fasciclin domain-containing protein [Haloferula rosea]MBK1828462.1 fasciclin domain-containing protein [Haloferula rosea]
MKPLHKPFRRSLTGWVASSLSALGLVISASAENIVDVLASKPEFSTLVSLVQQEGLESTLRNAHGITILAPTNAAFAQNVPAGDVADILQYHVLPNELRTNEFANGLLPTLLPDSPVRVSLSRFFFYRFVNFDNARVTFGNIEADNGVIHQINAVLDPAVGNQPTLLEAVAADPQFSTLAGLIQQARLTRTFARLDSATVFAPTNAAFEAVPAADLQAIASNRRLLQRVLLNHVARGEFDQSELLGEGSVQTLTNKLRISGDAWSLAVDGVPIVGTDAGISNGIVHVVDQVLVPRGPESLVDVASNNPDLSTFVQVLGDAGLAPTFDSTRGRPTFTVFAPNNRAFGNVPSEVLTSLLNDPTGALADVLRLHVVPGTLNANDLFDGQILTSLAGDKLLVAIDPHVGVTVNGAPVVDPDFHAANGVLHVMGDVISPVPVTIADLVRSNPELSTLGTALELAGLDGLVADAHQDLTVFAPTNDAFDRLPEGVLDGLLNDPTGGLADVLRYHVAPGGRTASELLAEGAVPTALGPDVTIENRRPRFFFFFFNFFNRNVVEVNGVRVEVADIETDNGVIHIIRDVLIPPTPSRMEPDLAR